MKSLARIPASLRNDLGRAYLLGYLTVGATFLLTAILLWQHPNQYQFILGYWKDFVVVFVVPLAGVKALDKFGTAWANRGSAEKPKPEGD